MVYNRKQLVKWYWQDKLTLTEIGKRLNRKNNTIHYWFEKLNIPRRSLSQALQGHIVTKASRIKISKNHYDVSGKNNPHWKGGRADTGDGYIKLYKPNHPNSVGNYVLEHRYIMSQKLGRPLKKKEIVHHINHIKTDNRKENLILYNKTEHDRINCIQRRKDKKGRFL